MKTSYQQARMSRDPRFDGTFFIAVKTTKIFCRSICPANLPQEKNVEYFQHAQQAMFAGFRPCLRCRPDSAPQSFPWEGVNTTVNRAMGLLRQHHQLSIEEIASKLGISSRYFRQLFQKHLGLSPKQYQLFDKILFAKRLLHQSAMPIEHVAQASGFASARRLQHSFKKITGLTPKQVRKNKDTSGHLLSLTLSFRPPFHWQHMRQFLALRAIDGIETVTQHSYSRTFITNKEQGWFTATFKPGQHCFVVDIHLNNIEQLSSVLGNIQRIFDLNADTQVIQGQLIKAGLPEESLHHGLRLPGVWDTFEAGCRAILGQQISVKAAITLLSLLTTELGEKKESRCYFPTPEAIANNPLEFLKIPNSRKNTLRTFAQYYLDHPNAELNEWINIKGIGPWTIAYANMRGLSAPDMWLDTDLIIKKQLAKYNINATQAIPWRSYLTFQLWSMA